MPTYSPKMGPAHRHPIHYPHHESHSDLVATRLDAVRSGDIDCMKAKSALEFIG